MISLVVASFALKPYIVKEIVWVFRKGVVTVMLSKDKALEAKAQSLNEREKEILSARWGLDNSAPLRIEELNEIYRVTIEQLRDLEKRVFQHI